MNPILLKEVRFRLSGLEFEDLDTNGRSIEEYYFAACLNYAEEMVSDNYTKKRMTEIYLRIVEQY